MGITRRISGMLMDGDKVPLGREPWPVLAGGTQVGVVTSAAWSPRLGANVARGMTDLPHHTIGTQLEGHCADAVRQGVISEVPFPGASQR